VLTELFIDILRGRSVTISLIFLWQRKIIDHAGQMMIFLSCVFSIRSIQIVTN